MTTPRLYFKAGQEPFVLNRARCLIRKETDTQWYDLCHVKECKISVSSEEATHKNLSSSIVVVDRKVTTSMSVSGSMTIDALTENNLVAWLMSTGATEVTQSGGTWTSEDFTIPKVGRPFELGKTKLTVAAGGITDDATPTPAALVEGTDFVLDRRRGIITLLEDGGCADGDTIQITGSYASQTKYKIKAGQQNNNKWHIWLCSDPAEGQYIDVRGYASLKPSGDLGFISEQEFMGMTLELGFNSHTDYGPGGCYLEDLNEKVA